ncbi:hypothetical protein AXH25_04740 (plasmid) [Borrelia miyamotoi]|nr:hypothetical protein AXH25_04740 [Borrelia miyamotoi]
MKIQLRIDNLSSRFEKELNSKMIDDKCSCDNVFLIIVIILKILMIVTLLFKELFICNIDTCLLNV